MYAAKYADFKAVCDILQGVEHPNSSLDAEERSRLPVKPVDLCAINIYGNSPTGSGGVKYTLLCFDVLSKYIKLYPTETRHKRTCLN